MSPSTKNIRIDLGGPAIEFINIPHDIYGAIFAAEIDGVRVPIRRRKDYRDVGFAGANSYRQDWEQAMQLPLYELLDIDGVTPERVGDVLVFTFHEERHYRSSKSGRVEISFVDGVVVIDSQISEQDDSYY